MATFVVGRLGRLENVDDGACTLLGYSRGELLALHGTDLLPEEFRPPVAATLDQMRRGTVDHTQGHLLHRDGHLVAVEVTSGLLGDGRLALTVRPRS